MRIAPMPPTLRSLANNQGFRETSKAQRCMAFSEEHEDSYKFR
jgi:hypothetical protein